MTGRPRKKIIIANGEGGSSTRVSRVVGQLGVGGTFMSMGEAGSVTVRDAGEAGGMQKRQTKKRKISTPDTALDVNHA
ncbi:hypothetical protein Tco_0895978 [Tanacetum coccineum]|uniref:Uncharacterized protein n=1 Tax=Tanacetum coccineum TaxID=301880 RepID=A0ABQ5CJI0_9ASTR